MKRLIISYEQLDNNIFENLDETGTVLENQFKKKQKSQFFFKSLNKLNRIQREHIIKFKIFTIEPSPKGFHFALPRSPTLQKLSDSIEQGTLS